MSSIPHHRARVAALTRSRKPDDTELVAAKRELAEARIAASIDRITAEAPALTDEQRTKLAELLRPVRNSGGAL